MQQRLPAQQCGRFGNGHPNIVPYQTFRTRDGDIILACGNDNLFGKFCAVADCAELAQDPRFATNAKRVENRAELTARLGEIFGKRTTREWVDALEAAGVPNGPINNLAQVFAEPQVVARGVKIEMDHPTAGKVPLVASPMKFSGTPLGRQQFDERRLERCTAGAGEQLGRRAGGQHTPCVHGHQLVETTGLLHVGRGHQHGHAGPDAEEAQYLGALPGRVEVGDCDGRARALACCIAEASVEEIAAVPGIGPELAARIREHLAQRDLTHVTVSVAALAKLRAYQARMGWRFKWLSSAGSDFNRDFGVSFRADEIASRAPLYNFGSQPFGVEEAPGVSVFARTGPGEIFLTYQCFSRGLDALNPAYQLLDLVPKGRDEGGQGMAWLRRRDEYGK